MIAGLLENSALLLPWPAVGEKPPGPGSERIPAKGQRPILDPRDHGMLGYALWRPANTPGWLQWLTRPVLEVHETEDAPLLFTLHCPWFLTRTWEVYEAEDHLVGYLAGSYILDRYGRNWAVATTLPEGGYHFLTADQAELGSLTPAPSGGCLTFAPDLTGHPFAKMLLLAGALALTGSAR